MRLSPLIHREFALLARSKWLWLFAVPVLWIGQNHLTPRLTPDPWFGVAAASEAVTAVSFAAIIVCFRSIIGERESGSIRLTAGSPLSRTALVVGTALGRGFALVLPVGLGVVGIIALSWARHGPPSFTVLAGFCLLAVLLVITYTSLLTAVSAVTSSTIRAAAVSIALVWLLGVGDRFFTALYGVVTGHPVDVVHPPSDPVLFLGLRLFPLNAYRAVVNSVLGLPNTHAFFARAVQSLHAQQPGFAVGQVFGPAPPFYLTPWFALLTLVGWCVLPLGLATRQFQSHDLPTPTAARWMPLSTVVPRRLRRYSSDLCRAPFAVFRTCVSRVGNRPSPGWELIAHRDFTVHTQSLAPPVLFSLTLVAVLWQLHSITPDAHHRLGANVILAAFQFPVATVGLLGCFFLGIRSIVQERESGAVRYTTGIPVSRGSVVCGKIIALSFAVGAPLVYGLAVGGLVGIVQYGLPTPTAVLGVLCATLLYLGVSAALFIGLSTLSSTSTRAVALGFASLLVSFFWPFVHRTGAKVFVGPSYPFYQPPPDTVYFVTRRLCPQQLFYVLSNWAVGVGNASTDYAQALAIQQAAADPSHTLISPGLVADVTFASHPLPVLLAPWVAVLLSWLWICVPAALAVYRFRTIDLT
ncbi:hypothetical protein C455_09187 [Haloferax larsenii JCM 13917]|nr:ABC transporter permease subunit [Haloferax larsenii]ELZ79748.1 hypothetical protein C455_09187 [Haloferax larsenii JCM 13917]